MSSNFSTLLKEVMNKKSVSQAQLSELTGIGKSSISQYLSGKNEPKIDTVEKIANVLNVSAAYLIGASDEEQTKEKVMNIRVSEAAKLMGKSEQFIRIGLQRNILPFGFAIQMSTKWTYHISPKLLEEYVGQVSQ